MATAHRFDAKSPGKQLSPEILDRLPPQNLEAERGVLGSLLLDPQLCDEIVLLLRPEDFYADAHRKLYTQMMAMHDEGKRIDHMLLAERLTSSGEIEEIGGVAYLLELVQSVPTAAHAVHYAEIVSDKSTLRGLIRASTDILRESYDSADQPRDLLNRAEEKIFAIRDTRDSGELVSMQTALEDALSRIDLRMQQDESLSGVETGFNDLDQLTGGMHGSELIILAARPGMGKTAFATNIAEHVALELTCPTLFVSLEMSRFELADRMLCSHAGVNGHRLRNGSISKEERRKLVENAAILSRAPLFIDDTPSRRTTEIAAMARRMKRKHGLRLMIIDYLQLIEPDDSREPRQEQVARMTRRLKTMARELDIPVLCLAQLNRQAEQSREGHRPKLSHLRESGAIEQDADTVLFVHREEYFETDPDARSNIAGEAMVIVAKQRHGPTGDVPLVWKHDLMRFVPRSHEWQDMGF